LSVARASNHRWAISSRGFNDFFANKLLVQIDGRAVYLPINSGVYWDTVDYPLEDIERIEVIRGPGASLWGANAVDGVVNIITKSASDTQGGLVSAGAGNEEKGFGTLRYGGKSHKDLFFRIYGKVFDRDEQYSSTADTHDDWQGASGGFRVDRHKSGRDTLTVQGDFVRSESGSSQYYAQSRSPYVFTTTELEIRTNINLLGRWTRQVSADSQWRVQFYWDHYNRQIKGMPAEQKWDIYDLDFQHQVTWADRHNIVYGAGYRLIEMFAGDSENDDGFILSWDRNRSEAQTISMFVQDEISLIENRTSLILGSKFEHNDYTGFEAQPTLRLRWTPEERRTGWAAVSRAVRTPNEAENGIRLRTTPVSTAPPVFPRVVGNPDLASEELLAYELGYRVQAADNFSVDSALFYNRYEDLTNARVGAVEPGPEGTLTFPLTFINGLNAKTYGAELAATWQVTQFWRLYAAYAFLKIDVWANDPELESGTGSDREEKSPRHQLYLQSCWDLPGNVAFDLTARYVDSIIAFIPTDTISINPEGTVDSYIAVDARLAWTPRKNLTLELVGQNLFDDHHREFGTESFLKTEPVEIERSVYGKVTWHF
jgi:iron complex outermembrane receptor protein